MNIERVTNTVENKSIKKVRYFSPIFREINNTKFDKISFSFSNLKEKKCVLITENFAWLDKYTKDKLYEKDPVCEWEDKTLYNLRRLNKSTDFIDINSIHDHENGQLMRQIRKNYNIKSGGVSVTQFDDIVLSIGWWSSQEDLNFLQNYGTPNNRQNFEKIIKDILFIYYQNKTVIFK